MFPHGGVNMTGLQLVNHANESVRRYVEQWNQNTLRGNSFSGSTGRTIMSVSDPHLFCALLTFEFFINKHM